MAERLSTASKRMTSAATVVRTAPERGPAAEAPFRRVSLRPGRALAVPLAFTLALVVLGVVPAVRQNPRLLWSFWGAAAVLLAWNLGLFATAASRRRNLTLEVVLRKQHYLQACAQGSVLLYWGWYWRQVYDSAHLIAAQLLFAYAFDTLLAWSRRETYTLGFGVFPVIFSINLFLWFKPDWFYLQFLMIAVGFGAKELIRWNKDGRRVHIFNPSSFPLALFSVALLLTGSTNMTWGAEIAATQFYPPHIYLMLFLVGLPGQFLFGVTTMTMAAVVTTYLAGLLYFAATGTYLFFDSYIPIAVFLSMHLLFTDPSTSPRTELGRIIFGMLYGLSVIALYVILGRAGAPTFYDKLLSVPILNLLIKVIDRLARAKALQPFNPVRLGKSLAPRRRNLAYMSVWAAVFIAMSAAEGVGDTHRGRWLPFWQQACDEGRRDACNNLALMELSNCRDGSGWACNALGILLGEGRLPSSSVVSRVLHRQNAAPAATIFQRACALGLPEGCDNVTILAAGGTGFRHASPRLVDYQFVLREGKGPLTDRTPIGLYTRACDQGWPDACRQLESDRR
jgi:hypothetical protein